MEILKWVGYSILSIAGIGVALGVMAILATIGAAVGTIALGAVVVFFVAYMIHEYFNPQ